MPWRVSLIVLAVVLAATSAWFVPFLTREQELVEATPQPPPLFEVAPIELLLGWEVCTGPVRVTRATDIARIRALRFDRAGGPTHLSVTMSGPGYAVGRRFVSQADRPLDLALPDPPDPFDATLCVENKGPRTALLAGAAESRSRGRLTTSVEGEASERELVLSLLRSAPAALADRPGDLAEHAAATEPGFLTSPSALLVLAAFVVVGLPALVLLALRRIRSDDGTMDHP